MTFASASGLWAASPPLLAQFNAHGFCYAWSQSLIWTHVLSDAAIALAYFSIPASLAVVWKQRGDLPFHWMFGFFAAFIFACGATHAFEIWNVWNADYWPAGWVKVLTGLLSVATAVLLVRYLPDVLATPSPAVLARLAHELEVRVTDRTHELQLTNTQLHERERSLRFLADTMPQIVWTATSGGQAETFNLGWTRYTGLTEAASRAGGWESVLHPDDRAARTAEWLAMLEEGREGAGEYRLKRASDGQYRWHLWRARPERNEVGGIVRWVGTSTDIHHQKLEAERLERAVAERTAELSASEARYRSTAEALQETTAIQDATLNSVAHMIYSCGLDGVIRTWNRAAQRQLGWRSDAVIGSRTIVINHSPAELAQAAQELSRELGTTVEAGGEVFFAKARRGEVFEREWTFVRSDGVPFPARLSVAPLRDAQGNLAGVVGIAYDLTEHREADRKLRETQQRFRAAAEASLDGFYILEPVVERGDVTDFVVADVNALGAQRLGRTREQLTGRRLRTVLPGTHEMGVVNRYLEVLANRQPWELETPVVTVHGKSEWRRMLAVPVGNGLAVSSHDITERKRAEQRLSAFAQRLQEKNRELQDFAYVASHDLQEPLRKIQAFGGRLHDVAGPKLTDQERDYLSRMRNAAHRMQALIEALLVYSRVTTAGRSFERVALPQIAQEVLIDLEIRIEQTRGTVTIGTLPTLEADPVQMRQLLQNLIGNALKYHRTEVPPVVTVSSEMITDGADQNEHVRIVVADNGIGFEPKYAETVFGVFTRLHTRGDYEGTGVGLAICRRIVERHGGKITAESTPGVGSRFAFVLPLKQPPVLTAEVS